MASAAVKTTGGAAPRVTPPLAEQQTRLHALPSGERLEVISQMGAEGRGREAGAAAAPLVFLHGSYHAAWCYAEHWLPYFASKGHDCYALSLLGQGGSDVPDAPPAGTIHTHASDVSHFIRSLSPGEPPVLIGHSFGALVLQAYVAALEGGAGGSGGEAEDAAASARQPPLAELSAAVLACSVPPDGNSRMVSRFLMAKPFASVKVTLAFAVKLYETSTSLCRDTFFSAAMPDDDVKRYQSLMKASSKVPMLDLSKLDSMLPVERPPEDSRTPVLVLGAEKDYIVDEVGLKETAEFFWTAPRVVEDIAHDVMIDVGWQRAAAALAQWLSERGLGSDDATTLTERDPSHSE